MERITSLKNDRVQLWRSLKERKGRVQTGLFLVEGRKLTEEALHSAFPVVQLLVEEGREDAFPLPPDIPAAVLPAHVLAAVCDTKTPQGVAAVVAQREMPLEGRRLVVLDGVQDPGNVGTIIRTADAAGLDGVLLSAQCADVYSPKVIRATMGSVFHLSIRVTECLMKELRGMRDAGWEILSTQLNGEPFYEAVPQVGERFCLVIGNEGSGVTDEVKALATKKLRLPMRGRAESLNAAVAAGIMMYELTRER